MSIRRQMSLWVLFLVSWFKRSLLKQMPKGNFEWLLGSHNDSVVLYLWLSRVEVELRQVINDRDGRITELKKSLDARSKTCHTLRKQLDVLTKRHPGNKELVALQLPVRTAISVGENLKETKGDVPKETAKLRIELAKRKADILYLQGELAEAKAMHMDPSLIENGAEKQERGEEEKAVLTGRLLELQEDIQATALEILPPSDSDATATR